jgi:hypothetical protein
MQRKDIGVSVKHSLQLMKFANLQLSVREEFRRWFQSLIIVFCKRILNCIFLLTARMRRKSLIVEYDTKVTQSYPDKEGGNAS